MVTIKVSKIGNSIGVIFPKAMLLKMHLKEGDIVYAIETPDGYRLTPFDEDFGQQMKMAQAIIQEEKDVLRVLAE